MSVEFAILGALQFEALTGYDIKKIFQEATFMHWSGNNNQVYKALLSLQEKGYASSDVEIQLQSPSRKRYRTTAAGSQALKEWLKSEQEPPYFKKTILVQLFFARGIEAFELIDILANYQKQLENQLLMHQNNHLFKVFDPHRSDLERLAYTLVNDNVEQGLMSDIAWAKTAVEAIVKVSQKEGYK